ncbi:hypothetical protein OSCT_3044 [Oscillochloris trichoides DG-6]|uniref:Uncharacterized protein n=1 Tax=Oscillochloris trichoides DG-6 TaxID=765420 RepID=E1II93_9CHLR|nr:hypothetical protein OSCT_3044 [Oscillochloris trichoides DG-6]
MTLATGTGLSLYGDWYMNNDPSRQQWWNNKPGCSCQAPTDPSLSPEFFLGLIPGTALGIGMAAGGLSAEMNYTLVPGPHNPTTQAHLDYVQEQARRFGGASQRYLDELVDTGAARVRSTVNWGLGEGVSGSTGFLQAGTDGVLFAGGLLDAGFQGFGDRDLCLSPRQKFNRMLVAGALGMAVGGVGLAASHGANAGRAAIKGVVTSFFAGAINELVVKPSIYDGLGLK